MRTIYPTKQAPGYRPATSRPPAPEVQAIGLAGRDRPTRGCRCELCYDAGCPACEPISFAAPAQAISPPRDDDAPKPALPFEFDVECEGFTGRVTMVVSPKSVPAALRKLAQHGIRPAAADQPKPTTPAASPPGDEQHICPLHNVPMSKKGAGDNTWYSHQIEVNGDKIWCKGKRPRGGR